MKALEESTSLRLPPPSPRMTTTTTNSNSSNKSNNHHDNPNHKEKKKTKTKKKRRRSNGRSISKNKNYDGITTVVTNINIDIIVIAIAIAIAIASAIVIIIIIIVIAINISTIIITTSTHSQKQFENNKRLQLFQWQSPTTSALKSSVQTSCHRALASTAIGHSLTVPPGSEGLITFNIHSRLTISCRPSTLHPDPLCLLGNLEPAVSALGRAGGFDFVGLDTSPILTASGLVSR